MNYLILGKVFIEDIGIQCKCALVHFVNGPPRHLRVRVRQYKVINMSPPALKPTDELAGELLLDLRKAAAFEESSLALLSSIAADAQVKPEASRAGLLEPHLREVLFEISTLRNRRLISRTTGRAAAYGGRQLRLERR